MPRFRFKLQPVLAQREREEQQSMRVVGELERERLAIESRIRACQDRIVSGRRESAAALAGDRVDLGSVRLQAAATMRDDQVARRGVLELASLLRRLESARRELAAAAARRRAMELLRDRELARYKEELDRRERADLDDLTIMRHRGAT